MSRIENNSNSLLSAELERQKALEEAKQAELARIAAEEAELERQLELEQQAGKISQIITLTEVLKFKKNK